MVYSHWLCPGSGQGPGPVLCRTFHIAQGQGRMGCMVLIRTFHTASEQEQGRTLIFITGNIFRTWKMGTKPNLQVLKLFPVFFPVLFRCSVKGSYLNHTTHSSRSRSLSQSRFRTKPVWIHHKPYYLRFIYTREGKIFLHPFRCSVWEFLSLSCQF